MRSRPCQAAAGWDCKGFRRTPIGRSDCVRSARGSTAPCSCSSRRRSTGRALARSRPADVAPPKGRFPPADVRFFAARRVIPACHPCVPVAWRHHARLASQAGGLTAGAGGRATHAGSPGWSGHAGRLASLSERETGFNSKSPPVIGSLYFLRRNFCSIRTSRLGGPGAPDFRRIQLQRAVVLLPAPDELRFLLALRRLSPDRHRHDISTAIIAMATSRPAIAYPASHRFTCA